MSGNAEVAQQASQGRGGEPPADADHSEAA